jgi:hypothetical protein
MHNAFRPSKPDGKARLEHFGSEFDTTTVSDGYSNNARGYFNGKGH